MAETTCGAWKIDPGLYHRSYAHRRVADRVMQRAGCHPNDVRSIECIDGAWHLELIERNRNGGPKVAMLPGPVHSGSGRVTFELAVKTRFVRTTL